MARSSSVAVDCEQQCVGLFYTRTRRVPVGKCLHIYGFTDGGLSVVQSPECTVGYSLSVWYSVGFTLSLAPSYQIGSGLRERKAVTVAGTGNTPVPFKTKPNR